MYIMYVVDVVYVTNTGWLAGWLADELSEGDERVVRICANE